MVKTKSKSSDRTSISYKLTRAIFVASSIIAFIVSSVLFFFDYRRDKLQIDTLYQAGRSGAVNSLLAAITKNDFLQIQLQTDGLVLLPGIEYARIVDQSGDVLASSGLEEKT